MVVAVMWFWGFGGFGWRGFGLLLVCWFVGFGWLLRFVGGGLLVAVYCGLLRFVGLLVARIGWRSGALFAGGLLRLVGLLVARIWWRRFAFVGWLRVGGGRKEIALKEKKKTKKEGENARSRALLRLNAEGGKSLRGGWLWPRCTSHEEASVGNVFPRRTGFAS